MGTKVKEKDLTTDSGAAPAGLEIDGRPARARILDAAFAAFSEYGYAQTSMLEIATRAKVSKRELYALVGNKDDMLAACITDRAGRLHLPAGLPEPVDHRGLEAALLAFGARLVAELSQPVVIGVFRLAIAEAERAPEIARTLDRVARSAVRGELRQLLEAARDRGLLAGDPAQMVRLFMALLWDDLLVNLLLRTTEPPTPAEAADRARDTVTGLLQHYSTGTQDSS